jgi:hypothetical protein
VLAGPLSIRIGAFIMAKYNIPEVAKEVLAYFKTKDALQEYWKTHSRREIDLFVQKTFKVSYFIFRRVVLDVFELKDRTKAEYTELNRLHREQTNLERYGRTNVGQFGTAEYKAAMIAKYGVDNYFKTPESAQLTSNRCKWVPLTDATKKKISETVKSAECQYKTKQTNLEKYGVEYTFQVDEFRDRAKQTKLIRYWNAYFSNFAKAKLTKLKRYNNPVYTNREKARQTLKQRYGIEHPPRKHYHFNSEYFDSLPELAYYLYSVAAGDTIIRNPCKFSYCVNGVAHFYFPDFSCNGQLVEIKGAHFLAKDGTWQNPYDHSQDAVFEAKHQCAIANNVKILYEADYQKYLDWFYAEGYVKEDFML